MADKAKPAAPAAAAAPEEPAVSTLSARLLKPLPCVDIRVSFAHLFGPGFGKTFAETSYKCTREDGEVVRGEAGSAAAGTRDPSTLLSKLQDLPVGLGKPH